MQHILRRSLLRGDDCRCFGWKIRLLRTHVGGSCSGGYAEKHVEPLFFEVNEDGRIYGRSVYVNTHTMYRLHMQINTNNDCPCTLLNHEHPTHGSLLVSLPQDTGQDTLETLLPGWKGLTGPERVFAQD